jgi:2-phospho-L-lactate guanylyltransferase
MQVLVVPVKSLERAKSRLASVLRAEERAALSLAMLEDVLDACGAQESWETWVVSHDRAVATVSGRHGAEVLPEEGRSLLAAVRQAEKAMAGRGGASGRLAVLLADLPFLSAPTLSAALALGENAPVVAAPAGSDAGTNLLVRHPATAISARFGRASFAKHVWAARRARLPFVEARFPELAFDLDRPGDLARVLSSDRSGRTRSACLEMGLAARLREHA